ncbi:hypothetical protein CI784_05650 [Arthrobacter agilis]|nr:hypothetical protein CI784_05650 [Arthrobacter agilis]
MARDVRGVDRPCSGNAVGREPVGIGRERRHEGLRCEVGVARSQWQDRHVDARGREHEPGGLRRCRTGRRSRLGGRGGGRRRRGGCGRRDRGQGRRG